MKSLVVKALLLGVIGGSTGAKAEASEEIPVVSIWSAAHSDRFEIGMSETCFSPAVEARIKRDIGKRCQLQLPKDRPAPYYAYECAYDGLYLTPEETHYSVHQTTTRAWVPPTYHSYSGGSHTRWTYRTPDTLSIHDRHSWYRDTHETPGYWKKITETAIVPHQKRFCALEGQVHLNGIDPIQSDRMEPRDLFSTTGDWESSLSALDTNGRKRVINRCFAFRKLIFRDFFPQSRIKSSQSDDGTWSCTVEGIHPYRTPLSLKF